MSGAIPAGEASSSLRTINDKCMDNTELPGHH